MTECVFYNHNSETVVTPLYKYVYNLLLSGIIISQ